MHLNGHVSNGATPNGYADVTAPAATSGTLNAKHRDQLANESAISTEAIEARGYFTQADREALRSLDFAPSQCLPPALVIPLGFVA